MGFRKAEPHPCSINASHAAPRVSFLIFYCSPPFPPPSVANPKNGTIPVLHVSLPALDCPHQQPVGDGMKQLPCPGGLTTILPLSRLCQQLQPMCSGSQSDSKKGSFASFPRFFSMHQELLDPAELPAARAVGRWKGLSHLLEGKKDWEVVWIFKRKPTGNTSNETDSGRGSNTRFCVSSTSQGVAVLGRSNTCSGLSLQGVENLRTSDVGC